MRREKKAIIVAVLAIVCVALAACGSDSGGKTGTSQQTATTGEIPAIPSAPDAPGVTADRILLGAHTSQSGTLGTLLQVFMPGLYDGAKAFFSYMNDEHGGVCGGKKIEWRVEDDQGTSEGALSVTKRLAEDDKVFAFFFSMGDFVHNPAVVQYLNGRRIPDMYLITGGDYADEDTLKYRFMFRALTRYHDEGLVIAQFIRDKYPGKRVGILNVPEFQLVAATVQGVKDGLAGSDNQIVAEAKASASNFDLTPQILTLKEANPDIIVSSFLAPLASFVLTAMEKAGVPPDNWTLVGSSATSDTAVFSLAGDKLDKLAGYYATVFARVDLYASDPRFEAYRQILARYATDAKAVNPYVWFSFANGILMVETLERACEKGPLTREGLVAAAESIDGTFRHIPPDVVSMLDTVPDPIKMSPTDHNPFGGWVIVRGRGGKWNLAGNTVYRIRDGKVTEGSVNQ